MSKNMGKAAPITLWKPKKDEIFVRSDGSLFVVDFRKVFDNPGVDPYVNFMLNKTSYENQLEQITHYTNYFINKYDKENELLRSYLHIKYVIDVEKTFDIPRGVKCECGKTTGSNIQLAGQVCPECGKPTKPISESEVNRIIKNFIDYLYEELFYNNTHIVENIMQLVEDNYYDNVEKSGRKANQKEYLESLEFTNEHVKIMLAISFGMKIISPIAFHYLYINMVKLERDSMYIYNFYKPLFDLFSKTVNIFNKLYVYVKSRILESYSVNTIMYDRREIFGVDVFGVVNNFTKIVVISENMVKYSFPSKWSASNNKYEENIPGLTN